VSNKENGIRDWLFVNRYSVFVNRNSQFVKDKKKEGEVNDGSTEREQERFEARAVCETLYGGGTGEAAEDAAGQLRARTGDDKVGGKQCIRNPYLHP
jgi:hypothetical protein